MTGPLDHKIFEIVAAQAAKLKLKAFVIGGYVRDHFLQRESTDIDIVVEGSGIALAEAVAEVIHTNVTVFRNFGTAMLKYEGIELEFVGARRESYRRNSRKPVVEEGTLEDDQLRRDFTINALAFSLQKEDYGTLIDPFGGIRDLDAGLIRTPADPDATYSDDPLRMIRAIRFATQLGFQIVPESLDSISRNAGRLDILARERIAEELHKILMAEIPSIGLRLLDECALLPLILPAISNLKSVEMVNGCGHKDNFEHTLQVLDNVASAGGDLWLRWAALLHDVGKPATKKFEAGTGWTFHGHEYVGSKMVPGIFKQLKMPLNDKMKFVQKMVLLHLRPIALVTEEVTDSAVRRLLFDAGDDIDDLMTLCRADVTSKNEYKVKAIHRNFEIVEAKLIEVEAKDALRNFKNPITGELIMEKYGLPPCATIGVIKDYIKNAILDGEIPNEFEAAYRLMESKAAEMGLEPKSQSFEKK